MGVIECGFGLKFMRKSKLKKNSKNKKSANKIIDYDGSYFFLYTNSIYGAVQHKNNLSTITVDDKKIRMIIIVRRMIIIKTMMIKIMLKKW